MADTQFGRDLFERPAVLVQSRSVSTPRVVQTTTTRRDTRLSSESMHSRAMHPKPPRQLIDRHSLGVLLGQRNPIGDTQTGLRTG